MEKISNKNILQRIRSGEPVSMNDPEYSQLRAIFHRTKQLSKPLNQATTIDDIRIHLSKIIEQEIDQSTVVFTPFYTNIGVNITLGERVFINHACSMLDLGGITIEDDVMIGPRVNITSENHPVDPKTRKTMTAAPVIIKKNAWIGAGATILPNVAVGENAVVAAGAVVTQDVPANTVVAGVPAKVVKQI